MKDAPNCRPLRLSPYSLVSLPPGVRLEATGLVDEVGGGRYELNRTGIDALELLSRGLTLGEASTLLAARCEVAPPSVFGDLTGLLASLDAFDLLVVQRGPLLRQLRFSLGWLRNFFTPLAALVAVQTFLEADRKRSAAQRYHATLAGAVLATTRAMRYILIVGCVIVPLALICVYFAAGTVSGVSISRYSTDLGRPILITGLFVAVSVIHELAHLGVLKINRVKVHYISARNSVVAIHHATVSPALDAAVAIAGPAVACGVCVAVTAVTNTYYSDLGIGADGVNPLLLIGALNLLTLNPWSADGRALWHGLAIAAGKR